MRDLSVLTQTVANGCRRLRTQTQLLANTNATFGEHSLTSRPPKSNGNPRYAFGKNQSENHLLRPVQLHLVIEALLEVLLENS